MLRLLADENFNGDVLRGLMLRHSNLDVVRAQDVGLFGANDEEILAWAARADRIVLSHDRATMPHFAYERVAMGNAMPGVFILGPRRPVGETIAAISLVLECSEHAEWQNRVVHLPL